MLFTDICYLEIVCLWSTEYCDKKTYSSTTPWARGPAKPWLL